MQTGCFCECPKPRPLGSPLGCSPSIWSPIARSQGGSVGGYTPGAFAAYYIVWTLVRNMNIVFTPYGWEWRIREGQLSGQLLRPLHPIHYDLAWFAGWKVAVVLLWLPIPAILSL